MYCYHLTSYVHSRMMLSYACMMRRLQAFVTIDNFLMLCSVVYLIRWLLMKVVEIACLPESPMRNKVELGSVGFEPRFSWSEDKNFSVGQKSKPFILAKLVIHFIVMKWHKITTNEKFKFPYCTTRCSSKILPSIIVFSH